MITADRFAARMSDGFPIAIPYLVLCIAMPMATVYKLGYRDLEMFAVGIISMGFASLPLAIAIHAAVRNGDLRGFEMINGNGQGPATALVGLMMGLGMPAFMGFVLLT